MRKKIGLALGSGSSRGWAHIGVLKALEEAHIPIDYIAGTSIGAWVGAAYACGELNNLEKFVLELDWKTVLSYFDVTFPRRGLLDGNKIYHLISQHILKQNIEDLNIPFCCVATDLLTGHEVRFYTGNLVEAVRASISLPGIFTPLEKDGMYLVDGGLVNPVPVNVVKDFGADVIIAVDLNHDIVVKRFLHKKAKKMAFKTNTASTKNLNGKKQRYSENRIIQILEQKYRSLEDTVRIKIQQWLSEEEPAPNIFDVMGTSISIMEHHITRANLAIWKPDVLIQPALGHLKMFDFNETSTAILEGYNKTKQRIQYIKSLMNHGDHTEKI